MSEFFDTFLSHDKLAALEVLRDIPVLVACGERDRMTPAVAQRVIADALPDAELEIIDGAGHMAMIDRYPAVNRSLRRLVERATETLHRARWMSPRVADPAIAVLAARAARLW